MKKINLFAAAILFTAPLLAGCQKGGNNSNPSKNTGVDVYVAGGERYYFQDHLQDHWVATVWKNGVATNLTAENANTIANSIFVSGSDVYVAGEKDSVEGWPSHVATVWKNGVAQHFRSEYNDGFNDSYNSVFVSGNDVYLAGGNEYTGTTIWKNGVSTTFSGYGAGASSIFVSGSDVYVVVIPHNIVLKNGQVLYNNSYDGCFSSVFVSGNDVYVAGGYDGYAILWKNGVEQKLTDGTHGAYATSVFVLDKDVYVVGIEGNCPNSIAVLWKNGVEQKLTDGTHDAYAYSVFVVKKQ